MTDERPLIEGIDAYHKSLKEGARRERKRILKLIDQKIKKLYLIDKKTETLVRQELEELKEELKK